MRLLFIEEIEQPSRSGHDSLDAAEELSKQLRVFAHGLATEYAGRSQLGPTDSGE